MSVQTSTLENGLRVVSHDMPHLKTVSLGVWIGAGSRNERMEAQGTAHFLEHMAFKGTAKRSAYEIVAEIESVGGDLNAATGLDQTAYHALLMKDRLEVGVELLGDILLNPRFDVEELQRERGVILQEIMASDEMAEDVVFDLGQALAFPGQAIGRSVLGTFDSVSKLEAFDLEQFMEDHYTAQNMVVAAAGAVEHKQLVEFVERHFAGVRTANAHPPLRAEFKGGLAQAEKQFDQAHLLVGFEGVALSSCDLFTAQILSHILGGGMSSRLFQEIRERLGLAYTIYSFHAAYADTGLFGIYGASDNHGVIEMAEIIMKEFASIGDMGVDSLELDRAKAQLKTGLAMSLESSYARAEQLARQTLFFDRIFEIEALTSEIDSVNAKRVLELAYAIFTGASERSGPVVALAGGDQPLARLNGLMKDYMNSSRREAI